jgi:peptidoglycan/xylan/chitin deacetylase (PgdA/CDA1 family)
MGGRVEPALDIMNWLIANDVHATVFMTGAMADNPNTEAGRAVLRLIEAHPTVFDLGNHSYSHPDFRELTAAEMASELSRAESAIAAVVDVSPRPWFRPPFGGVNAAVVSGVAAAGYDRTIMWDVDTIDWLPEAEGGPTAVEIVAKVTSNAQGGSIVLMHLGGYNTYEALPGVVAALKAKGLQSVTLGDLLP